MCKGVRSLKHLQRNIPYVGLGFTMSQIVSDLEYMCILGIWQREQREGKEGREQVPRASLRTLRRQPERSGRSAALLCTSQQRLLHRRVCEAWLRICVDDMKLKITSIKSRCSSLFKVFKMSEERILGKFESQESHDLVMGFDWVRTRLLPVPHPERAQDSQSLEAPPNVSTAKSLQACRLFWSDKMCPITCVGNYFAAQSREQTMSAQGRKAPSWGTIPPTGASSPSGTQIHTLGKTNNTPPSTATGQDVCFK